MLIFALNFLFNWKSYSILRNFFFSMDFPLSYLFHKPEMQAHLLLYIFLHGTDKHITSIPVITFNIYLPYETSMLHIENTSHIRGSVYPD